MTSSSPRSLRHAFRNLLNPSLRAAAIALALTCLVPITYAQSQSSEESRVRDIRSLNATEKKLLLARIQEKLRYILDHAKPFSGQASYTPLKLKFRTEALNEVLVIDLGAANGPVSHTGDMSELEIQLESAMGSLLDELGISYPDVDYEFGGRDALYYNPEDRKYSPPPQTYNGESAIPPQGAKVVISAMHGYYWRHFEKVWALQRPELSNGIYEDFITPTFVDPLSLRLTTRSSALIYLPRSQSTDIHPGSGFPW